MPVADVDGETVVLGVDEPETVPPAREGEPLGVLEVDAVESDEEVPVRGELAVADDEPVSLM